MVAGIESNAVRTFHIENYGPSIVLKTVANEFELRCGLGSK